MLNELYVVNGGGMWVAKYLQGGWWIIHTYSYTKMLYTRAVSVRLVQ